MNVSKNYAGGWGRAAGGDPSAPPTTTYYLGNVKVVKVEGRKDILLIRGLLTCPHQEPHVHYYISDEKSDEELERLIDWLENGFWWDSFGRSTHVIEERFIEGKCMGNAHFL
jgi:hypothetical protein